MVMKMLILNYVLHFSKNTYQFMMEVRHLQFLKASSSLSNVRGGQVLLQQHNHLLHQVFDRPCPAPDSPDIIKPHQPMTH